MKKFSILLACAAMALAANAQAVKFYYQGKPVETDKTLTFGDTEDDGFGSYMFKPEVFLKASSMATVRVKAECTTGQNVNLCFGGQCGVESTTVESNPTNIMANQLYALEYDYVSNDPINEVIKTNVSVINDITEEVFSKITIVFDPAYASVNVIESDKAVSYYDGELIYNVEKAADFALFSTDGKRVISATVQGNGSFSTSSLAKGIYVYRLGNDTGKIIVK